MVPLHCPPWHLLISVIGFLFSIYNCKCWMKLFCLFLLSHLKLCNSMKWSQLRERIKIISDSALKQGSHQVKITSTQKRDICITSKPVSEETVSRWTRKVHGYEAPHFLITFAFGFGHWFVGDSRAQMYVVCLKYISEIISELEDKNLDKFLEKMVKTSIE